MQPHEVNALPERPRRYIHDLETRCDPSGDIRELWQLREQVKQLTLALASRINQEKA